MPQCEFRKQTGQQCRANALRGASLCVSHNPKAADLKRAAAAKGGRNRRIPKKRAPRPEQPVRIKSIEDVGALLLNTLEELRNGALDADLARSVGYLAGVTAKVFETVDLSRRVGVIEENLAAIPEKALG